MSTRSQSQRDSIVSRSTKRKVKPSTRPLTGKSRPKTNATSTGFTDNDIICAIAESRGLSPTVGLVFVNITTCEAVLCQFADTQTYARTCHKIMVFSPSEILHMATAIDSPLLSIIQENLEVEDHGIVMTSIDRKYWSESVGFEYIQQLAFLEDIESLKTLVGGNYFAICSIAAVFKYIDLGLNMTFAPHSLRIRFEPCEGSMMIDWSTINSLELIQNQKNMKSKECLIDCLDETLTKMGARVLRSNVLQPSTDQSKLLDRYSAVEELARKEQMFFAVRTALKSFVDTDRVLAALVLIPTKPNLQYLEQSVNHVLMLRAFVNGVKPIWQALAGAASPELQNLFNLLNPQNYAEIEALIKCALNDDVTYSTQPTELRNQRVYAIRAGVNGFLDVARQTYKEINQDVFEMISELKEQYSINLDLKFDPARQYYLRISLQDLEDNEIPADFINLFKKKNTLECQTMDLVKLNQKIKNAHDEVISMSDQSVQELICQVRSELYPLFKISEGLAMLDMIAAFAQLVTTRNYIRPELTSTLALKACRHPIRERTQEEKFIANDVYATQQKRFQIITGSNMSGKSTYIRSIAMLFVMAQIGCFIPAEYASFPIVRQLFARISSDDSSEATVSTFSSEMREMAFILRNIEPHGLVIIDELGRGTSTTDGLAIAIAIAEALIESKSYVWFVTHFRDLPRILAERAGVVNLHFAVDLAEDLSEMKMSYRVVDGYSEEKFYGLAMARVVGLPEDVLEVATKVSQTLNDRNEAKKSNSRTLAVARRRKLVLNLREMLLQVRESNMSEPDARKFLQQLQEEFTIRMSAINAEASRVTPSTHMNDSMNDDPVTSTGVVAKSVSNLGKGYSVID